MTSADRAKSHSKGWLFFARNLSSTGCDRVARHDAGCVRRPHACAPVPSKKVSGFVFCAMPVQAHGCRETRRRMALEQNCRVQTACHVRLNTRRAHQKDPQTTNPATAGLRCEILPLVGAERHKLLAERAGFEPAVGINPHTLSRRAT